jgi:DNA-binding winged helix-turn-helix (wHTH) protein
MNLSKEDSLIILDIYRNISDLRKTLEKLHNSEVETYINCDKKIGYKINSIIESDKAFFENKLADVSDYIKNLIEYKQYILHFNTNEVEILLNKIAQNIQLISPTNNKVSHT